MLKGKSVDTIARAMMLVFGVAIVVALPLSHATASASKQAMAFALPELAGSEATVEALKSESVRTTSKVWIDALSPDDRMTGEEGDGNGARSDGSNGAALGEGNASSRSTANDGSETAAEFDSNASTDSGVEGQGCGYQASYLNVEWAAGSGGIDGSGYYEEPSSYGWLDAGASCGSQVESTVVNASAAANGSGESYSSDDLRSLGVIYDDGYRYTWYSQRVLPGGGLNIEGRHVSDEGYVVDSQDRIVVASSDLAYGTTIDVPFGNGKAVVLDTGCTSGTIDVYTDF